MSLSGKTNQAVDSRLTFNRDNRFQIELRRRVDEFFRSTGRRQRDCPEMYLKTGIILLAFGGFYGLLVFAATTWWQALPLETCRGPPYLSQHHRTRCRHRRWISRPVDTTSEAT